MQPSKANKQRGVALIMVLLVVALIAVIAVNLGSRLQMQVLQTANLQQAEQSYWMWLSAEEVVGEVIKAELQDSDGVVNLQQNWAQQTGPFPVEGGTIAGQISDLHACFNLNALAARNEQGTNSNNRSPARYRPEYMALLKSLSIDDYTAQTLADTLIDWLDADTVLTGTYGAEDPDYLGLPHPYLAANSLLLEKSELRQIRGYSQEVYQKLAPYVCVIPGSTELVINVNTVDQSQPQLLVAAASGELDLGQATKFLQNRRADGYKDKEAALASPILSGLEGKNNVNLDNFGVKSNDFSLLATIQWGDLTLKATSVMQVTDKRARVTFRSFGE
ncbi:type II secretory pathway protein [Idiomarina tyrosinivorans]|uniref:Type II secretion system protein K n=1 Tax=Idiomarina tyrosinivorans TaxID=1445662 RepID=A0A432ZQT4_9GAMM|nr:type II secretion system minor pseudopilin GspK [Idiomarina tyrosinivorans]RUO80295.1 type II secretory pathway protein [Idiomarina tyrosinivorans]